MGKPLVWGYNCKDHGDNPSLVSGGICSVWNVLCSPLLVDTRTSSLCWLRKQIASHRPCTNLFLDQRDIELIEATFAWSFGVLLSSNCMENRGILNGVLCRPMWGEFQSPLDNLQLRLIMQTPQREQAF